MATTSCYLVLEPSHNYQGKLTGIKVDRVVQSRPPRLAARHIAVELTINVDNSLFEQFQPGVTINIKDNRELLTPEIDVMQQPEPEQGDDAEADNLDDIPF